MSKKFIPIKVNPENQEHPENIEAVRRYQVSGFPTIVFASSDGGMIAKQVGFIYPNDFAPVIEAALEKEQAFMEKLAALDKTPDDVKLNSQVSLTYLERMQLEKALPFSKKAFEHDPKNKTGLIPDLHNQLGLAYAGKVEAAMVGAPEEAEMYFEKAVSHFRTVIDEYPKSDVKDPAQYYLGITYAIKGEFDDAISVLEKLVHHTSDANIKQNAEAMLERVKDLAGSN
ncbi:hypothetical protein F4Z99_11075 [Candidatus Poribacteria bacterium]|nr:hypothetical protein [Candidatus Poribacteria bacterium]